MIVGGLPPIRRTVLVLYFRCQGQLAGWLASLTLEDEVRPDLDLPRVVCKYKDVFQDELLG